MTRTTDIAIPDQQPTVSTDLELWARQATAAAVYAERVCSTLMAPVAYRGKPAEACAAILAGAELGFSPMRSLNAFDNIQGTPAPKAMTLRALVQAAGHEVRIVDSTNDRAVVAGRRRGDTEWQTSVWDVARAEQLAQYKSNPNYRTNRAQMLVARATAEVCRWVAADAIMGVPYAAEEAGDFEPAAVVATPPATRRLTVAELDEPAAIEQRPAAELVTREQQKAMFALWGELGYGDNEQDRKTRLDLTARFIGADAIESSNDLTAAEADTVIAKLRERKAATDA
jgi:hypothetical protein